MNFAPKDERRACRELGPSAALERALDFAARWRGLGGELIALDDFYPDRGCESLDFGRLPEWAEEIGAVRAPGGGRALIWTMPSRGSSGPFQGPLQGPFQIALRRPLLWKGGPAFIRYAGITEARESAASGRAGQRFSGLERASGETLVLTLPALGESLTLIAEIE